VSAGSHSRKIQKKNSEFDKFARGYEEILDATLCKYSASGKSFARRRVDEIAHLYNANPLESPKRILDFRCGVGAHLRLLSQAFVSAKVIGVDTSKDSIQIANQACEGAIEAVFYDGYNMPSSIRNIDLVVAANVFTILIKMSVTGCFLWWKP